MSYVTDILKYESEIGTPNKPPRFLCNNDYPSWKVRFESFILYNDPDLWECIENQYIRPRVTEGTYREGAPYKPVKQLTAEEKKEYDRNKKAFAAITMCLPSDVLSCFKTLETAHDLWDAIGTRFGGNKQLQKSRQELLKRQFDLFKILPNESIDAMLTRYSQLYSELKATGMTLDTEEVNKKLIRALPRSWDSRAFHMEQNEEMPTWKLETIIGKIQLFEMNI